MAEQNEGYLSISVDQQESTSDIIPAEKMTSPSQSKAASSASAIENNETQEEDIGCFGYSLVAIILIIAVILILALVLVLTPIIAILVLPLMLSLYFIAHIVQVFRSDDDNNVGRFMGALAKWLWVFFGLISVDLLLCMLIFGVTPSLKHRTVHGVSIARWIGVLTIICVFLTYSMLIRYLLGYRRLKKEHSEEKTHLYEGLIGAINSLFYLLALFSVTRVAPILKEHTILNLPTQKWIRMILFVVFGHHALCIFTSSITVSLRNKYILEAGKERLRKSKSKLAKALEGKVGKGSRGFMGMFTKQTVTSTDEWTKYVVYYAEGLRRSFNFMLTSLLVLLTWILYFGPRLDRSSSDVARVVYDFGWWTFACILVSAVLWLVKSGIILTWKARVVYNRFNKKILRAADQLYLMGIIAGPKFDLLGVWKKGGEGDQLQDGDQEQQELAKEGRGGGDQLQDGDQEQQELAKEGRGGGDQLQDGDQEQQELAEEGGGGAGDHQEVEELEKEEDSKELLSGIKTHEEPPNLQRRESCELTGATEANSTTGKDAEEDGNDHDDDESNNYKKDEIAQKRARKYLVREKCEDQLPYTSNIVRMARYFMAAEVPLSRDGYVVDFVAKWRIENPQLTNYCNKSEHDDAGKIEEGPIRNLHGQEIEKEDANLFKKQRDKEMADSEKWIMKNHKVCLELGRTLSGAMEVVDCLNNIMILVLVGAVIVIWLLLTGIATTKVLVVIASPILAASFVFAESAKTLFQGIMFTYVMHPFDVGDLCTINNFQVSSKNKDMLEVKRIGVWKTILSTVGTSDEVVYPNTVLANTSIVTHKGELDPNDNVELRLKSSTNKEQIINLITKIEQYLNDNKNGFKKHPRGVLVKDLGKTVTIDVHFEHEETTIEAMMSTDGLQKKSQRRHEFLLEMKTYMDEFDIKESTKPQENSALQSASTSTNMAR